MNRLHACTLLLLAALIAPVTAIAQGVPKPNDPGFDDQWALELIGAQCAWGYTLGRADVTVAVIDSGIDLTHPDLVDHLRSDGHDFVDGDDDPSDENGHGTNVAGIIAATINNAEGVVGLAPEVSILPVRVMNERGSGSDRAIARGIRFAAERGAQVINLSLGATLMIGADTESAQVTAAIRDAQEQGALVVVSAGNDFVQLPNAIVGDNPDVLVVAASDQRDRKADFSNSGEWIAVTAPGVHILSTMPTYEVYLTSDALPRGERFQQDYDYMSGTSQAAPYVSALAALLFSAHPDWDARQVAAALKSSAADISRSNPRLFERGVLGSGRIDACQALGGELAAAETPVPLPTAAPPDPTEAGNTTVPEPTPGPRPTVVRATPEQPATPVETPSEAGGIERSITAGVALCGTLLLLALLLPFVLHFRRRAAQQAPPAQAQQPVRPAIGANAATLPAWGALSVISGPGEARRYALAGGEITIGREPGCTITLAGDSAVSRRHAIIRNDTVQISVMDAGSTHGTFLNGERVSGPVMVRRGDVLKVGLTLLRFE